MKDFTEFVGVPYEKADCWRLSQLFYQKVFGIELKSYYEHTPRDRSDRQNLIFTNVGEFKKVDKPEFGDLILIRVLGIESHIAVYIGDGMMLHTSEKTGSVLEPIARWQRRIVGFYRTEKS
jgi:cell wall-associated NlpC family hydrolase